MLFPVGEKNVSRLEEKAEHFESALAIVQRGLQEIPRYGPLWFGAFRLSEKLGEPACPPNLFGCKRSCASCRVFFPPKL